MHRRSTKALVVAAIAVACAVPAGSQAAPSPTALLASILAAGNAQRSVHYRGAGHSGTHRIVQVTDVGRTEGIQRITFSSGGQTGHASVVVASNTAYVRGDTFVLVSYMGFKPAAAAKYANTWVLIPHTDRDYSTVAEDVTLPSTMATLRSPGQPVAAPGGTIGGQKVVALMWRTPVSGKVVVTKLYARASGAPLPVQQRTTLGAIGVVVNFSRWNEPLKVTVPKSATPIATTGLE